ncbi:MAG: hypothetical protein FJZ09_03700 [Candidatus Omnitrophica bacterium]|nr:hypothetical protein [Candidatus Omnitrophota bacterium]
MRQIMKLVLGAAFLLVLSGPAFSLGGARDMDAPPPPDLSYPTREEIDLTAKDSLEFRWYVHDLMTVSYCEFKLYKGYVGQDAELIISEKVTSPDHSFAVGVDRFQAGQVYTWTVRAISYEGWKSDTSSYSFKVVKK